MSAAAAPRTAPAGSRGRLLAYRDDGPLADGLGRALGPAVRVPGAALTVLSAVPLIAVAVLAIGGESVSRAALGAAVAWSVLAAGVASGRPDSGRFEWAMPPLLRLLEYGSLLAFAALAAPSAVPVCFALVGALAFHHYDIVYRLRHQGVAPPRWLSLAGGGWDGRVLLGYLLLLVGAVDTGFLVVAVALGFAYVAESTLSWLRCRQPQRPALYDDDEDEDE
jgi:hypothetical protein